MGFDVSCHSRIKPPSHHSPFLHRLSDLCGTDIIQRRFHNLHRCRQSLFFEFASRAAINQNGVVRNNFIRMIPTRKTFPIIRTNH